MQAGGAVAWSRCGCRCYLLLLLLLWGRSVLPISQSQLAGCRAHHRGRKGPAGGRRAAGGAWALRQLRGARATGSAKAHALRQQSEGSRQLSRPARASPRHCSSQQSHLRPGRAQWRHSPGGLPWWQPRRSGRVIQQKLLAAGMPEVKLRLHRCCWPPPLQMGSAPTAAGRGHAAQAAAPVHAPTRGRRQLRQHQLRLRDRVTNLVRQGGPVQLVGASRRVGRHMRWRARAGGAGAGGGCRCCGGALLHLLAPQPRLEARQLQRASQAATVSAMHAFCVRSDPAATSCLPISPAPSLPRPARSLTW